MSETRTIGLTLTDFPFTVKAGNPKEETIYEMLDQLISELGEERNERFPEDT